MLFVIISEAGKFIAENPALIAMILVIVEYVKRWTAPLPWMRPAYMTALGFVLGFLFAVPSGGIGAIDMVGFISHGVALGGVATGLFKVGSSLAEKAQ